MKKIIFITTLTCLLYTQAKGQSATIVDSLPKQKSGNVTPLEPEDRKPPEIRKSFTKTDSSGNTTVLNLPSAEFRIILQYPDSLKNDHSSVKQAHLHSEYSHLMMGQIVTQEGLYRLSESFFNGAIDSSAYRRLYSETLQYTIDLISEQIDLEDAKTEKIKAETERSKIEVEKLKLEVEKLKIEKGIYSDKKDSNESILPKPVEESGVHK